ncbi:carboxyltransferase domain-containing protein [Streptomyces sp. AJS327]|uniref:5-oxoprolinase subunit B family protein n=1 Tax=Streptomyces sp. AJS327 TaxID=2545265 RepID=UPI0015DFE775|nr:carboxyltransferase domain-containing protein [Streptomyces sp. AJS327]MBA0050918.1 carboxyltransferase domain-containing protein [Streptomyces sp. AJS327]
MNGTRRLRPAGERGLLIETPDDEDVHALATWLRAGTHGHRLVEIVPGPATVLVVGEPGTLADLARELERTAPFARAPEDAGPVTEVKVVYDGVDLDAVCAHSGLTRREVVEQHTGALSRVDYFGFSPGVWYANGVPGVLRVPRMDTPRTRVPEGAVAIANEYTSIYPGGTPGGWRIIGRSVSPSLWDPERTPPNLIDVGDRVRFVAVAP